jgi:hypothetical protein
MKDTSTQARTLKEARANLVEAVASTAPRQREINDFLARKICRDLEIAEPQDAQPGGQHGRPPAALRAPASRRLPCSLATLNA